MTDRKFVTDLVSRPWLSEARYGLEPIGVFLSKGRNAIEVVAARSLSRPGRAVLLEVWKSRRGRRAAPVLLGPIKVFITNKGPYFVWPRGDEKDQAFLLGVLYSIPLDWYALRFVEINVNFFIINHFPVPRPARDDPKWQLVVSLAGRLACPDERFFGWANTVGVSHRPLAADQKEDIIHKLDAVVAHLYGLDEHQLVHVFGIFHEGWDHGDRIDGVLRHFKAWGSR